MARFILRQPIRFVEGTGFTIDNGNEDIILRENTTVTFNIGQDVSTNQTVIFNTVTSSLLNVNDSTLRFTDSSISGSTSITADFVISNNLIAQQNIIVAGQITAEEFLSDFSQSTTIFKSGSSIFGTMKTPNLSQKRYWKSWNMNPTNTNHFCSMEKPWRSISETKEPLVQKYGMSLARPCGHCSTNTSVMAMKPC